MALFGSPIHVLNVGVSEFSTPIRQAGARVVDINWKPPGEGNEHVAKSLAVTVNDAEIEVANSEALDRYLLAEPRLVGVGPAGKTIPGFGERMLLHAGPPITWDQMCKPVRGAIIGACLYEGWADDPGGAQILAGSGEITFVPCHELGAVGPMAGVISPSMPTWIVKNPIHGNASYSTLNEGLGKALRFGAYGPEVIERLRWFETVLGPTLSRILENIGELELKPLMAQALQMGDELHNRPKAATSLFLKTVLPAAFDTDFERADLKAVTEFIANNDHFFLNVSMAACKVMMDVAHDVKNSTMVTAIARNGVDLGIRVSGLGNQWVTTPAPIIDGLFFPGYSAAEANPDLGDSSITETAGFGGFAMAAAPAIVQFVGGTTADAQDNTRRMSAITIGLNQDFTVPALDFAPLSVGIDIRKVVDTSILPVINTGIAHHEAGIGQIGAGISHVPQEVFIKALEIFTQQYAN